jgi:hypothetical protein
MLRLARFGATQADMILARGNARVLNLDEPDNIINDLDLTGDRYK